MTYIFRSLRLWEQGNSGEGGRVYDVVIFMEACIWVLPPSDVWVTFREFKEPLLWSCNSCHGHFKWPLTWNFISVVHGEVSLTYKLCKSLIKSDDLSEAGVNHLLHMPLTSGSEPFWPPEQNHSHILREVSVPVYWITAKDNQGGRLPLKTPCVSLN